LKGGISGTLRERRSRQLRRLVTGKTSLRSKNHLLQIGAHRSAKLTSINCCRDRLSYATSQARLTDLRYVVAPQPSLRLWTSSFQSADFPSFANLRSLVNVLLITVRKSYGIQVTSQPAISSISTDAFFASSYQNLGPSDR
jgi:hypothetical protein